MVSFDTGPELVADLTNDTETLAKAVRDLRPGGGTALYDAIFFACKDKLMLDQPMYKFRRRHGHPERRRRQRKAATPATRRSRWPRRPTSLSTLFRPTSPISQTRWRQGDAVLRHRNRRTYLLPVQGAGPLHSRFENIANELRHQYNLFYRPEPAEDRRAVSHCQIKVKKPQGSGRARPQGILRPETHSLR